MLICRDTQFDCYHLSLNMDLGGSVGKGGCLEEVCFPKWWGEWPETTQAQLFRLHALYFRDGGRKLSGPGKASERLPPAGKSAP